MSQRGAGFKHLEDEILCNAYIHHSTNSEIGTYQSKEDLWAKIESYYNHEVVDVNKLERRNTRSLCSRFDKLATSCILFRAVMTQVQSCYQSGGNAESILADAKELYIIKEPKNQPFKFDHAWNILMFHVKWAEPIQTNNTSSLLGDSATISQDSDGVGSQGRSTGMKAAKAKRKMTKEKDPMWQEMMKSAAKSQELMKKQHADYLAIQEKRESHADLLVTLKKEKIAMKQKALKIRAHEQEMEIMNKDLSNLTPFSKQFWTNKKQVLINSENMSRAARNLNFDAGGSGGSYEDVYVPESPNNRENNSGEDTDGSYDPTDGIFLI